MSKQQYTIELPSAIGRGVNRTAKKQRRKPSDIAVEAIEQYFNLSRLPEEISTLAGTRVVLAGPAQKPLKRIPVRDQMRIRAAIDDMEANPFPGDINYLKGQQRLRPSRRELADFFPTRARREHGLCRSNRAADINH